MDERDILNYLSAPPAPQAAPQGHIQNAPQAARDMTIPPPPVRAEMPSTGGPAWLNKAMDDWEEVQLPPLKHRYWENLQPNIRERVNQFLTGDNPTFERERFADKLTGSNGYLSPVDLIPGPGDVLAFDEAQTPFDYGLAAAGTIPIAGKPLKAGGKVLLNALPTTKARRIVKETEAKGGHSVNLTTGQTPDEGLMVGKYRNDDPRNMVLDEPLKPSDVEGFVTRNEKALTDPENFLGTWRDPETAKTYLDVSKRFDEKLIRPATKFGEKTGQIAGYDVGKGDEFVIGNWQEHVASPLMQARLSEMHEFGDNYLKRFGGKEWWDKSAGTSLDRVYGPSKSNQVGGFLATTAPNSNLRANTQAMSEYMRRNIKGEDIIQSNWRAADQPGGLEGMLGGVTSGKMPMETGRANNLRVSQAGLLPDLSGHKVRDEALASIGDTNAAPLDRMWVHASEDPARGIYQGVEKGKMAKDTASFSPYMHLRNEAVVPGAAAAGEDIAPWSAKVWTGIREKIKQTSDLWGTKHVGSAIRGDSKGYADHFDDLIGEKAKKLGISVKEMERKLSAGDANLLSYVLAAPVGYGIMGMLGEANPEGQEEPVDQGL